MRSQSPHPYSWPDPASIKADTSPRIEQKVEEEKMVSTLALPDEVTHGERISNNPQLVLPELLDLLGGLASAHQNLVVQVAQQGEEIKRLEAEVKTLKEQQHAPSEEMFTSNRPTRRWSDTVADAKSSPSSPRTPTGRATG